MACHPATHPPDLFGKIIFTMIFKDDDFWKPVITTRQIIEGSDTITSVTLDEEGDWQALGDAPFTDDNLDVLSIEEMLAADPTLSSLPDMRQGDTATRDGKDTPWVMAE